MSKIRGVKKKLSTFRKTLYSVLFALGFATISSCAGGGYESISSNSVRTTTSDTTSYVQVGEIWDSTNKTFNKDNVNILMKYISGNASATISNLDSLATTTNSYGSIYNGFSSAGMRAKTLSAGTEGSVSYVAKSSSQDIQVKLGGLEWECVYLSKDTDGNTILTLWLDNCVQDAWSSRSSTEGKYFGYKNGGLYSEMSFDFSYGWNTTYPAAVYGASYLNAVVLNNGGIYATSNTSKTTATQLTSSAFAMFTMSSYGLTNYMVTPRKIDWQQYQDMNDMLSGYYNCPNDAWSTDFSDSDFYSSTYNLTGKEGYSNWADSYLWLPSYIEAAGNTQYTNLWQTSENQRKNYDGSTGSISGSVGSESTSNSYVFNLCWVRSGEDDNLTRQTHDYLAIDVDGTITYSPASYFRAVRPALHLNITKIAQTINTVENVEVNEIWNSTNRTFNKDNINILMKYISGNSGATLETLDTLAQTSSSYGTIYNGYSASNMRAKTLSAGTSGSTSYVKKTSGSDIQVSFGGLKWQCVYLSKDTDGNTILTLWLDNCVQDAWKSRSSTEGAYYGFRSGGLFSTWSSNFYDLYATQTYPSDMYGTSYINAVTLNNGGTYATSTTEATTVTPNENSVFALYTMGQYGLTNYLVTPSQVSWQESQLAKTVVSESYNMANEAWSASLSSGFYNHSRYGVMNYASKTGNDYWASSYLWLPSVSEAGYSSSKVGLWNTSVEQRKNYNGTTTSIGSTVGSSASKSAYTYSWLRSGYTSNARIAYFLYPTGSSKGYDYVNNALAVRPALHLNLTAVVNGVDNSTYVQVGELYDTTTQTFNSDNLDIMYKYLTGDANATASDVNFYNSMDVREITLSAGTHNGVAYSAKKAGQDVVVRLCGLDWYVVANQSGVITLYLKGGAQEAWASRGSTEGEYYGFIDGVLYGDFSANFQSTSTSNAYPSNMYGTSYLNAEILGNLFSSYATNGTTSVTSSGGVGINHPFYYFNNYNYTLNNCLVIPDDMGYYSSTSETEMFPNDLLSSQSKNYSSSFDYSSKSDYDAWWHSVLWLPGLYELEQSTNWMLSDAQKANGDLTDSFSIMGTVGTKGENAYASTWLRSGHKSRAYMAYTMLADGTGYGTSGVGSAHVIRPALNLDLSRAETYRN